MAVENPPAGSSSGAAGTGPGSYTPGDTPRRRLNVVSSYALIFESNNAFPSLIRQIDPSRLLCVVRNVGVNIIMIKFSANGSGNYNAPSWVGADVINPGEEWVTEGSSAPIFLGPQTQGQGVTAAVYTELGVL